MQVTEEMIRLKAFELWETSGKPTGSAEANWFAARAMLLDDSADTSTQKNSSPPNGLRQLTSS